MKKLFPLSPFLVYFKPVTFIWFHPSSVVPPCFLHFHVPRPTSRSLFIFPLIYHILSSTPISLAFQLVPSPSLLLVLIVPLHSPSFSSFLSLGLGGCNVISLYSKVCLPSFFFYSSGVIASNFTYVSTYAHLHKIQSPAGTIECVSDEAKSNELF